MTKKKQTSSYWENRAKQERKWQEKNIASDAAFARLVERYYNQVIAEINKDIDHQYQGLAKSVGGLKNAYAEVNAADIADYENEARQLVIQAAQMRAQGKHVTYASFSDDVNRRMKIYNATMRINRLEYLKSQAGLHLTKANMNIANELNLKLTDSYINEVKRQSGILGKTLQYNTALIDNNNIAKIVMASTEGANWSQRLWLNQDALKAQLDAVLSTGIIAGQSNQTIAKRLRDQVKSTVKNHSYVTERLVRTETARIQYNAQIDSIKAADYRFVKWYAEPGACRVCQRINDNDEYDLGYGVFPVDEVPEIPIHPNCRCSISAYWVDGKNNLGKSSKEKTKSAKRATKELSDFASTVKTKGLKPEIVSMVTDAFNDVNDNVKIPKLDSIEAVTGRSATGKLVFPNGGVASYNYMNNTLYLNSSQMKSLKNLKNTIEQEKQAERTLLSKQKSLSGVQKQVADTLSISKRTNVDPSPKGIITHELGHAIQYQNFLKNATADEKSYVKGDWGKKAAKVSYYATTDPMEYFAESFVAYLNGETEKIDSKLLNYFKTIHR